VLVTARGGILSRSRPCALPRHGGCCLGGARAEHGQEQRVKAEGLALRQSSKGLEASSRARYEVRRWFVGMERGRQVNAHYVFGTALAFRVRAIAASRKQTRERGHACLVRYSKESLMVSYLGQRSMFINWPCPWMSRANQRERETGLEVWRVGGCRVQESTTSTGCAAGAERKEEGVHQNLAQD
jgi:hypothetical protein